MRAATRRAEVVCALMTSSLLARLIEVPQIWRRLVLPGGHQPTVGAEEIAVVADARHRVVPCAGFRVPEGARLGIARGLLGDRPGPRQRIVEHRDLVVD